MQEALFLSAKRVVDRLRDGGFEAYFVGGCVRDLVMGKTPKDVDIATSATPEQVKGLFPRAIMVGAQFGVVRVRIGGCEFEVATFRADGDYHDGRRPASVHYCDAQGDVNRRDFTLNGMLHDPATGQTIDLVGGQTDIAKRVVRCIGDPIERFREDKLRVMRAVRFACRLDFSIDPDTFAAAKAVAPEIGVVSAERIRDELVRILTEGGAAAGVQMLADLGVLAVVLPEVAAMQDVPQPAEFHPEGCVFTHTKLALAAMDQPSVELAVATLLHDVGKPATLTHEDRIRFTGHAEVGATMARRICRRLKFSNAQTEVIEWLVARHMHVADAPAMRIGKLKRFLRQERFADLLNLYRLDCVASHGKLEAWDFCQRKLQELSEEDLRPAPLLSGRDLIDMGYPPGPEFKAMLDAVESAQLGGEIGTRSEAEEFVRRAFPLPPG